MATVLFKRRAFTSWYGLYLPVVGNWKSKFMIKYVDGKYRPCISQVDDDCEILCPALDCGAADEIVNAVNDAKGQMSCRASGGSFIINEHSQVIVPSPCGTGERLYVGDLLGNLLFFNPDIGEVVDLSDDSNLASGDLWDRPYVGSMYHLSKKKKIYAVKYGDEEKEICFCPTQDLSLVNGLRSLRDNRGCRFIVNPYGIVITKKKYGPYDWRPHYVGRIDRSKWFEKER